MSPKASLKRSFISGIITSLVTSALIGIVVLLKGSFDSTDGRILATTLAIGVFSITSLANLGGLDSDNPSYRSFSFASIAVSLAAFVSVAVLIWASFSLDISWKPAGVFTVLAVSTAHASLLLPLRHKGQLQGSVVSGTLGCIALVAAMIIYLITAPNSDVGDFYFRLLGVFAILDVLGTIIAPILSRFAPKPSNAA